jgi:hypothetical protein
MCVIIYILYIIHTSQPILGRMEVRVTHTVKPLLSTRTHMRGCQWMGVKKGWWGMPSIESVLRTQCKRVISQEMALYDRLSRPSRLVYEHAIVRAIDSGFPSYSCGHGVLLTSPCEKCTRSEEECKVYRQHAMFMLQELLQGLEVK